MSSLKELSQKYGDDVDKDNLKGGGRLNKHPQGRWILEKLPIITQDIGNDSINEKLISIIKTTIAEQKTEKGVPKPVTNWFMHLFSSEFGWVSDQAIKIAKENAPAPVQLETFDCWGARFGKDGYSFIKVHNHWPAAWSWVYYPKACDDCVPLVFDDCPLYDPWSAPLTSEPWQVASKTNRIVVFPGWVRHSVPKHICDHDRVVVAGNIHVKYRPTPELNMI